MGSMTTARWWLRKAMSRAKLLELMAKRESCLVGMEACGGAHDLARRLIAMGHRARLMAARFVQPYRKSQKNDGNDAEAIREAVARPNSHHKRQPRPLSTRPLERRVSHLYGCGVFCSWAAG